MYIRFLLKSYLNNKDTYLKQFHYWQIITLSPWAFFLSIFLGALPIALVSYIQGYDNNSIDSEFNNFHIIFIIIIFSIIIMFLWFSDIVYESFQGYHTKGVQKNIIISFLFFLFSEIMLFVAFFWGFFHSSLFPGLDIGLSWPPEFLLNLIIEATDIPILNTIILITSGATLTLAHIALRSNSINDCLLFMDLTVFLALLFLFFQYFEYKYANFDLSDGIYSASFYSCTGLHGFHVLVGTIALFITRLRINWLHFSRVHHLGFELSAWYWHFVDIIWLLLFIIIYYWGNIGNSYNWLSHDAYWYFYLN